MTKTGWWHVTFDITLEGVDIDFDELSEVSQEHILRMIGEGCRAGEVVEECDDEDESNCGNGLYDCESCNINNECIRQEEGEEE